MTTKEVAREYKYNGNTCGERRHTFDTQRAKKTQNARITKYCRPRFHVLSSNFGLVILQE